MTYNMCWNIFLFWKCCVKVVRISNENYRHLQKGIAIMTGQLNDHPEALIRSSSFSICNEITKMNCI